jgi:hypothetical protein
VVEHLAFAGGQLGKYLRGVTLLHAGEEVDHPPGDRGAVHGLPCTTENTELPEIENGNGTHHLRKLGARARGTTHLRERVDDRRHRSTIVDPAPRWVPARRRDIHNRAGGRLVPRLPSHRRTVPAGQDPNAGKATANHVSSIFSKLQVADRAQAIVRARAAGLGRRPGDVQ